MVFIALITFNSLCVSYGRPDRRFEAAEGG